MDNWIELPVLFVDRTPEEIEHDLEEGVNYNEDDYEVDWCYFKESEIVAFNRSTAEGESTIRLRGGESYKIRLTYAELKNMLVK